MRPFVDTNVLLYLIGSDAVKAARAEQVLRSRIVVSVQVLNEFANVALRKQSLQWGEVETALGGIRHFADVHALTLDTHLRGLALARRHRFGLHDAMIAAAALEAGCDTLLSEDFQAGQIVDRTLTICNPFN